nr:PREDICTED: sperm-tail PG-rich repeat-containing protein 2-like [Linepithema humile]
MAFDRVEKFVKRTTSTCDQIGPGTYDVSDISKPPRDLDNAYPFLSGTSRQTLGIPKDAHKFPGPGSYNIEAPQKHIPERGGVSIDYTDVRFKEKVYEEPTTRYSLPDDSFQESPQKTRSHLGTWRGPAGKETNFTTLKYKGNFWSRMKGRDDERTSVTPGPGNYEHETKKSPAQIHDEKTREAKRATVKQPRFLEALYQQKLRQNFPAPNRYGPPKSVFDKYKYISCKCNPYKVEPPPFNQTAKRFEKDIESETPGPGTYEIANEQICYSSILAAPFGAFNTRFKKVDDTVTPGSSNLHNVGKSGDCLPEMTFCCALQVISTQKRVADVAQRNHFRLAEPEIRANPCLVSLSL